MSKTQNRTIRCNEWGTQPLSWLLISKNKNIVIMWTFRGLVVYPLFCISYTRHICRYLTKRWAPQCVDPVSLWGIGISLWGTQHICRVQNIPPNKALLFSLTFLFLYFFFWNFVWKYFPTWTWRACNNFCNAPTWTLFQFWTPNGYIMRGTNGPIHMRLERQLVLSLSVPV